MRHKSKSSNQENARPSLTPTVMKPKTTYLESGLVLIGTALTITTTIVEPDDSHFHVAGAVVLITGAYGVLARKLPDKWIYGLTAVIIALVGTGYFIFAFVTREQGIRHFFLIFFVEVTLMFSVFFVAFRQIRQLVIYNLGIERCGLGPKMDAVIQLDPEMVELNKVAEVNTCLTTPTTSKRTEACDDDIVSGSQLLFISNQSSVASCQLENEADQAREPVK